MDTQARHPEALARRRALLAAGCATLDRRLQPARVQHRRRTTTRPGTLLRHQILIYTDWNENAPGFPTVDTVAMGGEVLDYRGRGENSRNDLSKPGPMRTHQPAATRRALFTRSAVGGCRLRTQEPHSTSVVAP